MNESLFTDFPQLETERLILREVTEEDTAMVYQFNADLEALRYVPRAPYTKNEQAVEKIQGFQKGFRDKKGIWWTYVLKETGHSLGYGGLFNIEAEGTKAEIGYGILKEHWGRGYVGEAVKEMSRFGFEDLQLHRIFGLVDPANTPSARILEKLGYEKEGLLRHDEYARGQYFDMTVWGRVVKS
jgi:RimJ/RimL family protein N-acetyltransferase